MIAKSIKNSSNKIKLGRVEKVDKYENSLEEIVYKHALLNAAKHKGSANPGAVIGSIMSQEPDLRSREKEIGPIEGKLLVQVNN